MRISFRGWFWLFATAFCLACWWLIINGLIMAWHHTLGHPACITDTQAMTESEASVEACRDGN